MESASGDFGFNTLGEELALVQALNSEHNRTVGVYPEIKRPAWHKEEGVDIAPLLLEVLAEFGYEENTEQVFVQCFDDAEVRRLKTELQCPYPLVQLIGRNSWFESATDYEQLWSSKGIAEIASFADAVGPSLSHLFDLDTVDSVPVVAELVKEVRAAGLLMHPYTFRADELPPGFTTFEDLVEFFVADVAVDGLFTDFPDRVLAVLRN